MNDAHYLVPQQEEGSKTDLEYKITAKSIDDAEDWFVDAKDRMLDVNSWNKYCPSLSVAFRLTDSHGLGVGRHARKADLVRIDMPGTGGDRLSGFEWIMIEAIEYDDYPDLDMETFAVRVRVAESPLDRKDGHGLEVKDNATSTFVIERRAANLSSSYHGRNAGEGGIENTDWERLITAFLK